MAACSYLPCGTAAIGWKSTAVNPAARSCELLGWPRQAARRVPAVEAARWRRPPHVVRSVPQNRRLRLPSRTHPLRFRMKNAELYMLRFPRESARRLATNTRAPAGSRQRCLPRRQRSTGSTINGRPPRLTRMPLGSENGLPAAEVTAVNAGIAAIRPSRPQRLQKDVLDHNPICTIIVRLKRHGSGAEPDFQSICRDDPALPALPGRRSSCVSQSQ